jgi:hypothetical protein
MKEVLLYIEDDHDGSTEALRGWLASAGPDAPWRVEPPGPSDGMGAGVEQYISLAFGATGASAALGDLARRIWEWRRNRGGDGKLPAVKVPVEIEGQWYEMNVTFTPIEGDGAWPS